MQYDQGYFERLKRNGLLFTCIRKAKGLGQSDVAQMIETSQSRISKIESGILELFAYEWQVFAQKVGVPVDCILHGYIDNQSDVELRSEKQENNFSLPYAYHKDRCLNIRSLLPLLYFIKTSRSQEEFSDFLRDIKLHESFFCLLDNQLNLNFLEDLIRRFDLSASDYGSIAKNFGSASAHGRLSLLYHQNVEHKELLKSLITFSKKYDLVFNYVFDELSSNEFLLKRTFSQSNGLEKNIKDERLLLYFDYVFGKAIEHFLSLGSSADAMKLKVVEQRGFFSRGDKESLLIFNVA